MFFDWIVFFWWLSFGVSVYTFIYGTSGKNWIYMLISTLTFIPITFVFFSFDNALKYISLLQIVPIPLLLWFLKKEGKIKFFTKNDKSLPM